jgi:hypothetical protein
MTLVAPKYKRSDIGMSVRLIKVDRRARTIDVRATAALDISR